jgi:hypothetical protein
MQKCMTLWKCMFVFEHRLTESFTEIVIWLESKFIKRSFDRKYLEKGYLTENQICKTYQMTEMRFYRKFIWPKALSKNFHFTERLFDWRFIWPKVHLSESFFRKWSFDRKLFFEKWSFHRKFIWPNGHLTESFFRKMVIWPRKMVIWPR